MSGATPETVQPDPALTEAAAAFYAAIGGGDVARARLLVRQRLALLDTASPAGPSAILTALYHGHESLAREWLNGRTPSFAEACALGLADHVLAAVKADPQLVNQPAPDGFTPVGLAAYFGHANLVEKLAAAGADINAAATNRFKVNALHAAVAQHHALIVDWLLTHGAEPDRPQQDGFTALHVAAGQGDLLLARRLLKAGADPARPADDGRTPAALAREGGHDDVTKLLEQAETAAGAS